MKFKNILKTVSLFGALLVANSVYGYGYEDADGNEISYGDWMEMNGGNSGWVEASGLAHEFFDDNFFDSSNFGDDGNSAEVGTGVILTGQQFVDFIYKLTFNLKHGDHIGAAYIQNAVYAYDLAGNPSVTDDNNIKIEIQDANGNLSEQPENPEPITNNQTVLSRIKKSTSIVLNLDSNEILGNNQSKTYAASYTVSANMPPVQYGGSSNQSNTTIKVEFLGTPIVSSDGITKTYNEGYRITNISGEPLKGFSNNNDDPTPHSVHFNDYIEKVETKKNSAGDLTVTREITKKDPEDKTKMTTKVVTTVTKASDLENDSDDDSEFDDKDVEPSSYRQGKFKGIETVQPVTKKAIFQLPMNPILKGETRHLTTPTQFNPKTEAVQTNGDVVIVDEYGKEWPYGTFELNKISGPRNNGTKAYGFSITFTATRDINVIGWTVVKFFVDIVDISDLPSSDVVTTDDIELFEGAEKVQLYDGALIENGSEKRIILENEFLLEDPSLPLKHNIVDANNNVIGVLTYDANLTDKDGVRILRTATIEAINAPNGGISQLKVNTSLLKPSPVNINYDKDKDGYHANPLNYTNVVLPYELDEYIYRNRYHEFPINFESKGLDPDDNEADLVGAQICSEGSDDCDQKFEDFVQELLNNPPPAGANKFVYVDYENKIAEALEFSKDSDAIEIAESFKTAVAKQAFLSSLEHHEITSSGKTILEIGKPVKLQFNQLSDSEKLLVAEEAAQVTVLAENAEETFWPQDAEEWEAVLVIMAPILFEVAISFVPGADVIDLFRSLESGDKVGAALAVGGIVISAVGGSTIKGAIKGARAYRKATIIARKFGNKLKSASEAIKKGFKITTNSAGDVVIKKGDEIVSEGGDAVRVVDNLISEILEAQKSIIDKYKGATIKGASNNAKGVFGEVATDVKFVEKGYIPIHTRKGQNADLLDDWGGNGIDHVFIKDGKYYIVESKFGSSTLNNTADGIQMSDEWIRGSDRLKDAVGDGYSDILDTGYTKVLSTVNENGETVLKQIDKTGNKVNFEL